MKFKKFSKPLAFFLVASMLLSSCSTKQGKVEAPPTDKTTVEEPSKAPEPTVEPTKTEEEKPAKPEFKTDRSAVGKNGAVAAAKPEVSQIGVDILKKGGNAVDAAVAVGFAIGAMEPNASGLGGGGFMLIRMANGDTTLIDFRETAPSKATPDMFSFDADGKVVNNESLVGGKASGVPGEVAGLLTALENYGTMDRKDVIQPAIDFCENGIPVTVNLEQIIKDNYELINKSPEGSSIYLIDNLPPALGEKLLNPNLAKTLKVIAEKGKEGFYKGEIAEAIVKEVQEQGGIITLEDLANYDVKLREPIKGTYRGYEIISTPPASSGGTIIVELLNIMENFDLKGKAYDSPEAVHLWSEAMKLVYADRSKYMGDIDFVDVPLNGLTNKEYAKELAAKIDPTKSMVDVEAGDPNKYESGSTTHFSVIDKDGNMVAVTKSINTFFASGVFVPNTGIIMNNHMDDFTLKPGTANSIEPGKKPLSSMSPTIVLKDGKAFMAIGSPGATRIITAIATVISKVIDNDMGIQDAIVAPRIYNSHTTPLNLEGKERYTLETQKSLEELGHEIKATDNDYDAYFGGVQAVMVMENGDIIGGCDPRRDGQAAAY